MTPTPERSTTTAEDAAGAARRRTDQGRRLELVEEELQPRTEAVQAGVVRIRKQVVSETRTIEVAVRREELVVERYAAARPAERPEDAASEPPPAAAAAEVRDLQPGETLRIPLIEEEIVVQTRPMVVEEVIVGKRLVRATRSVTGTVRREQARVQTTGDVQVGPKEDQRAKPSMHTSRRSINQ
jgi:uncharacterized protein (TIGR02271 family)